MSELQSNKNNLSNIPGGFAIIPNALLGFLSDRACVVFQKIYQCQFLLENVELDGALWIKLSAPYLATSLNRDRKTIGAILDELLKLNIISCCYQSRKNILYRINWEEVLFVCGTFCDVNVKGRIALTEKCIRGVFTPMSQLPTDFIEQTKHDNPALHNSGSFYPNNRRFGEFLLEQNPIGGDFTRTEKDSGNFYSNNNGLGEILPEQRIEGDIALQNDKNDDDSEKDSGKNYPNNDEIRGKITRITKDSGKIRPQIYREEINKEDMREQGSQYREDKEKNLLEYFSSRSFAFSGFDKNLYESFLNEDLNVDDDDVVKSIKQVWNQLGYDKELPENNYIDLETFQNILFHSWQQLKQDYPDYSLSENDIKNIFGFLLVKHEGINCLYIDPSKLQDISAPMQKKPDPSAKETKYSDRFSRRLFIDCINEIANKDDNLLTSSEFVALLLMDYTEEFTSSYAAKITKMAYNKLVSAFADQSGVPAEDIKMLFRDLPQKGKVTISPQQLSPDKFFQYNADHQQESEVEKLFKTKLAEQN